MKTLKEQVFAKDESQWALCFSKYALDTEERFNLNIIH